MEGEFYKTKETVDQYITAAKGFDGKLLIEKLKLILPANSRVLEIGSGPGSDWAILQETYKVIGSDNSQEFLAHLKNNYPLGDFLELDAVGLNTALKFGGIYANKVLHHLKEDELLHSIQRQNEVLNANGIICHSFWKGEGSDVFKGLFVKYHTESSLKEFFGQYFDILTIETYKEFEADDSMLFIGRKKD